LRAGASAAGPTQDDPAALATIGQWYAFRGDHEWAAQLLTRARAGGAKVSALTLARCYWQLGRPADAAREFARARDAGEAPRDYLNLCIAATTRESSAK
jgi:Flp pilus assembly protein TadD